MAVSIDYATLVITVPRTDMTLVATTPTEIRELNIDAFRSELGAIMYGESGIVFDFTHVHTPPLTISGVTLARVVEIINGYTITFEDGAYNVNIVGGNSNIADVVNKNSVGVNTANSAGLQDPFSLQAASFAGSVAVKDGSGFSGTNFPIGTRGFPVDNLTDALSIAVARGLVEFAMIGDFTVATDDFSLGYTFRGDSVVTTMLTLDTSADLTNCRFVDCAIDGVLDGDASAIDCAIMDITVFNGKLRRCDLAGTVTLAAGADASFNDCHSAVAGGEAGAIPYIDMGGGSSTDLLVRHYSGGLGIRNCSDATVVGSIDMDSGRVVFDSDVTEGAFVVRGIADVTDSSTGNAVVTDATVTSTVNEIVGLAGRNKVVEILTKNGSGLPTSQRVRTYDTEANALTDDGVTGLKEEYTVTDTLTGNSLDKHTQTR